MNRTRVLLTVEQQLHAQLLQHALDACPELELVGVASNLIECMKLVALKKPDLWIHSWDEGPELSSALSHIYSLHPSLSVIRICPNESAGYIQMRISSLPDLLLIAARARQLVESA
jgi:DNA-binding NarL/FixJ family response regulator